MSTRCSTTPAASQNGRPRHSKGRGCSWLATVLPVLARFNLQAADGSHVPAQASFILNSKMRKARMKTATLRTRAASAAASDMWADLIAIETAHSCYTVGSRLSWPKPLPSGRNGNTGLKGSSNIRARHPFAAVTASCHAKYPSPDDDSHPRQHGFAEPNQPCGGGVACRNLRLESGQWLAGKMPVHERSGLDLVCGLFVQPAFSHRHALLQPSG